MSIDEKIAKLPEEKQVEFRNKLQDVLYDRFWCRINEIDYVDPNVQEAKRILYNKEYSQFALK